MKLFSAPDYRRAFAFLGALVLCLAFIACETDDPITPDPDPDPDPDTTVADVIEDRTDLSSFYDELETHNLVGQLADAQNVTVFAPDNDAFATADLAEADTQAVLEYHIVDGTFTEADLEDGMTIETWQGDSLEVTVDAEGNIFVDDAQITESDLEADNGVVHVIDTVLEPAEDDGDIPQEGTVVDVIEEQDNLTTAHSVIVQSDVETDLRTAEEVTVFAPNDDAFEDVNVDEMTEEELRNTIEFHVVDGTFMAADLEDGMTLDTWQGGQLDVTVDEEENVFINGAQVVESDLEADNGVVHVIDTVLEPEDDGTTGQTVFDLIQEDENLSDFAQALEDNNIGDEVADVEELTVFAPDNDAFDEVDLEELTEDERRELLLNHFVEGTVTTADLEDGDVLTTVADGELTISVEEDGSVFVEGATVTDADNEADDGVVHVIDTVLPSPTDGNGT